MKRTSSSVMNVGRGDQPKHCESQWQRLTPRRISKPEGLGIPRARGRAGGAATAAAASVTARTVMGAKKGILMRGS